MFFQKDGAVLSPQDTNDYQIKDIILKINPKIPPKVDLRHLSQPIRNQGSQGSCTGFSTTAIREIMAKRKFNKDLKLSPAYIYYFSRIEAGMDVNLDNGCHLRSVLKAWQKYGCCFEDDFPYNQNVYNKKPNEDIINKAKTFRINEYYRINSLNEIKGALSLNMGVIAVIKTNLIAGITNNTGNIINPNNNSTYTGYHAVAILGYYNHPTGQNKGYLVVKNSWGTSWGNNGYFHLPYEYYANWVTEAWCMKE